MTTLKHTHDDWLITVQTTNTGSKGPWVAQAHQVANVMIGVSTEYRYDTADDALHAIRDLIHLHQCYRERWNDFFMTGARAFDLAMNGDFDLTGEHHALLDAVPSPDAYQALRTIASYESGITGLTRDDLIATIHELQAMALAVFEEPETVERRQEVPHDRH